MMFDLRVEGQLTMILAIEQGRKENVRELVFKRTKGQYPDIFNQKGSRGAYKENRSIRLYTSKHILSESDIFRGDRSSWEEKVTEWVALFIERKYPKMNDIILDSLKEIEGNEENQSSLSEDS